ncbi:MAG: 30S ribosomal protein S5 [Candidatus Niyogibacteria bacterium]|nr:30S ribosomal protein S5 [Candidatus Niyogibacteria bacterium]
MNQEPPEFAQKMIDLRRVARVVAGGRRFNFRATVVVGNRKGEVGVGMGKGADTSIAMQKAFRNARKDAIRVPLTQANSIPHMVEGKFASAEVLIRPAAEGHGLVAGSSVRAVLDLAGVRNASAKILSHTKNKVTNAEAAIAALMLLQSNHAVKRT